MSALEELWLWLQGRNSQTDSGPDAMKRGRSRQLQGMSPTDAVQDAQKTADTDARVLRNNRYRAGPWQMK